MGIAPILQIQVIQKEIDWLEIRVVAKRALTSSEEEQCKLIIHERIGFPFRITLTYLESIPRMPNSKFEDFISAVLTPARKP